MKKFFSILTMILCVSFIGAAQEQHMSFMGIPITGSQEDFGQKLEAKGFVYYAPEKFVLSSGLRLYKGKFASEEVIVGVSSDEDNVYMVSVRFPEKYSFNSLVSQFNDVCEQYNKKYGAPIIVERKFTWPYYYGDGYEMLALKTKKCKYCNSYKLEYGTIIIMLMGNNSYEGNLWIAYSDLNGNSQKTQNKTNTIQQDI